MDQPKSILRHWFENSPAALRPIGVGRGFSGARHWQVDHGDNRFVLRQWPLGSVDAQRLSSIHFIQRRLAARSVPVPEPATTTSGATFVSAERQFWELATWMPGVADYWQNPRPEKLSAAFTMLAKVHAAIALPPGVPAWMFKGATGLDVRLERLKSLVHQELPSIAKCVEQVPHDQRELATRAFALVAKVAPLEYRKSQRWQLVTLPLQHRLRDIWHDHVLFTGDEVTGIIDFGAVDTGSPASDVARLLGSMVGDDRDRWRLGIEAYESVRPLTDDERDAIAFFDSTGVVLSTANWLRWLYGANRPANAFDREAALNRFSVLVGRLQNLAAANGV